MNDTIIPSVQTPSTSNVHFNYFDAAPTASVLINANKSKYHFIAMPSSVNTKTSVKSVNTKTSVHNGRNNNNNIVFILYCIACFLCGLIYVRFICMFNSTLFVIYLFALYVIY